MKNSENSSEALGLAAIQSVLETVRRLRAPGGCPWDREQTHSSLRPYLIEESYEVLDILDRLDQGASEKDVQVKFREELGDLLMQVLLHAQIAEDHGHFNFADVCKDLNAKLVSRHPHVFGDSDIKTSDQVLKNWEKIKQKEKKPDESTLSGVPRAMPALARALRVIEKVSRVGFQWENIQGPIEKLREETQEFIDEIEKTSQQGSLMSRELGDILFCLSNIAYHLKLNPEDSLRAAVEKFSKRFGYVEEKLRQLGLKPDSSHFQLMDKFWNEAKQLEQ